MFNTFSQLTKNQPIPMASKKPPISRLNFLGKEDPLSKKFRTLDNFTYQSITYSSVYGVNITSNEIGTQKAYKTLSQVKASKNSCHIGVSGWYNLDVIAIRRTERGIIFDSNPEVALFFDHTFQCIIDSADRETFIRQMKTRVFDFDYNRSYLSKVPLKHTLRYAPNIKYDVVLPENEIDLHAQLSEGWLANEECYQFIRHLVLKNKIVVLTADITHYHVFQRIHHFLENNGICLDTMYISNVHGYISKENQHAFLKTISCLSDEKTLIIDAEFNIREDHLEQRIGCLNLKEPEKQFERWFSEPSTMSEEIVSPVGSESQLSKSEIVDGLLDNLSNIDTKIMVVLTESNNKKVVSSCKNTFFGKQSEKKQAACHYSFVFVMTLLVATSAYLFNQLNQSDMAPQLQP